MSANNLINLKILQLNINGLYEKKEELEYVLNMQKFNCALISETHKLKKIVNIQNFNLIIKERGEEENVFGGVAILLKNNIKMERVSVPEMNSIEAVAVKLKKENCHLISIYVRHNCPRNALKRDFETLFSFCDGLENVMLGGDWNSWHTAWGCEEENAYGDILFDFILDSRFILLNDGSKTRINKRNLSRSTAIDLTMTSANLKEFCEWRVLEDDLGSDHKIVEITLKVNDKKEHSTRRFIDTEKINQEIGAMNFQELEDIRNLLDKLTDNIVRNTKQVKNNFIPKAWWNNDINSAKELKLEALRRFNRIANIENLIEVNRRTAELKRKIKIAKINAWIEFVDSINPFTSLAQVWTAIGRIEGRKRKKFNGNLLDDFEEGRKFMIKYFEDEPEKELKCVQSLGEELLSLEFLSEIINKKRNSAPGIDGITYKMVKNMSIIQKSQLAKMMNDVWQSGQVPKELKWIRVIPIQKPNKHVCIENMRPISLIQIFLKIMNSAVKCRLKNFVELSGLIPAKSFAFREGLGTEDAMSYLVNQIKFNKRKGWLSVAIFADILSAFNNVNIDILFEIMMKLKIPDNICSWIYNAYTNRKIVLKVSGKNIIFNVSKGLGQGEVFSPEAFLIYTILIHGLNSDNVEVIQYADDFVLLVRGRSAREVEILVNETLRKFIGLLRQLELNVNLEKTVCMPFSTSKISVL